MGRHDNLIYKKFKILKWNFIILKFNFDNRIILRLLINNEIEIFNKYNSDSYNFMDENDLLEMLDTNIKRNFVLDVLLPILVYSSMIVLIIITLSHLYLTNNKMWLSILIASMISYFISKFLVPKLYSWFWSGLDINKNQITDATVWKEDLIKLSFRFFVWLSVMLIIKILIDNLL